MTVTAVCDTERVTTISGRELILVLLLLRYYSVTHLLLLTHLTVDGSNKVFYWVPIGITATVFVRGISE